MRGPSPGLTRDLVVFHILSHLLSLRDWKGSFSLTPPKLLILELRAFLGFLCVLYVSCILKEVVLNDVVVIPKICTKSSVYKRQPGELTFPGLSALH